jgi:hypothetical protein
MRTSDAIAVLMVGGPSALFNTARASKWLFLRTGAKRGFSLCWQLKELGSRNFPTQ